MSNDKQFQRNIDENVALRKILEGTATETGDRFFSALVKNLAKALDTQGAWVTEYIEKFHRLRTLSVWLDERFLKNYEYDIIGTPCEPVIKGVRLLRFQDNVTELFPEDTDMKDLGAISYMGVPLMGIDDSILGHLAVLDNRPMPDEPQVITVFQIFAARAAAELQRLQAETEVRKSEEKYRRIVETAGEGFLLMDENLTITDVNDACCEMINYSRSEIIGQKVFDFATEEYRQFLMFNRDDLLSRGYKNHEGTVIAKDGRIIPILVHGSTLRDDKGGVIGTMAFLTDITVQKKSLALAGEVQKSFLPERSPQIKGFDIAGKLINCDEIGGDYFDFLWEMESPNGHFSAIVGDVTGHGVDAALLMTNARAILRMKASQGGNISQIVTEMNRRLTQDVLDTGRFMTLFYLTIDVENKQINWVRAGHDPAIIYDPGEDKFEELTGNGPALGLDERISYEENKRFGWKEGQIIAIGTDGIWEAHNRKGEMFGKRRFHELIRSNAQKSAEDIIDTINMNVQEFTAGQKPEDDITLVIIKFA